MNGKESKSEFKVELWHTGTLLHTSSIKDLIKYCKCCLFTFTERVTATNYLRFQLIYLIIKFVLK